MHCVCKRYGDDDRDDYELSLADYESNQEEINRLFPDAGFSIAFSLNELDEVITPLNRIIVKQTFNCHCYVGEPASDAPVPKWYAIHCDEGERMTNYVVIRELISQGFSLDCDHRFLEGFERSEKGGDCQFEPVTGS